MALAGWALLALPSEQRAPARAGGGRRDSVPQTAPQLQHQAPLAD
jgi:hypothetical protein